MQLCFSRLYFSTEAVFCHLSLPRIAGMNSGLKLEKVGSTFSSFNAMPEKKRRKNDCG